MRRFGPARPRLVSPLGEGSLRCFYSGLDEKRCLRLRRSSMLTSPPRGRDSLSTRFEQNIKIVPLVSVFDLITSAASTPNTCIVEPLLLSQVDELMVFPHHLPWAYQNPHHSASVRRALRKNGDTDFFRVAAQDVHPDAKHDVSVIPVVDPNLAQEAQFGGREEAQVELITAYRNILFEVLEARHVRLVKIPVLSLYSAGHELYEPELPKLTQQALIKGFHRIPNYGKEQLIWRRDGEPDLSIELYVPSTHLRMFEAAFKEDAWDVPTSTLIPSRFNLYPALAPPEQLLEYEGWVGKRPELIEAVKTGGKSLATGDVKLLDGTVAESCDVPSTITVYENSSARRSQLERERQMAEAAGFAARPVKPLQSGLMGDSG